MVDKSVFDKLGIEASKLGFGCMRFPCNNDGTINEAETEKMLDYAIKNGITYFDTAWMYHNGMSESTVGKLMKKHPRESFCFATKLPPWNLKDSDDVSKIFNKQLENLQTDYIDFYLLHSLNSNHANTIKKYNVIEQMEKYRKAGKIKYLGFSFHGSLDEFKEIINMHKWDFCQIQLNYMDINNQQGIEGYNILTEMGIPVVIMEPVKGGSLSNLAPNVNKILTDYNSNASAASWALRWAGSLKNVKVVLSGMSNMEQLADNIETYTDFKPLSNEEYSVVEKVRQAIEGAIKVGCTNCKYCIPCPAGVDIPRNFELYNEYFKFKNEGAFKWLYSELKSESKDASLCTKCGACVKKCPQGIDIPAELKELEKTAESI